MTNDGSKSHDCRPLVSVIVPVFNTERYITQCLESLRLQTLEQIEILLIDDGSVDSSIEICDSYARKDSRFKVIHKKNEGVSAARNDGIDAAQAEYIMFVDSDDWVEIDFCENAYKKAKESKADMVLFLYTQHNKKVIKKERFPHDGIVTSNEVILTSLWEYTKAYPWNKLYKRSLFEGIRYPCGKVYEDDAVSYLLIYKARRFYLLNNYLYNYRFHRPGSITNDNSYKANEEYFYFAFKRVDDLKKWGYSYTEEEIKYALKYLIIMGRSSEFSKRCEAVLDNCKGLSKNASLNNWVMYRLYKLSPSLFDYIAIKSKRRVIRK